MPNQIPNTLPGGPVNSLPGFVPSYIYYFRGASTDEQWYHASDLLGFGYGSSSTLLVYFRGAKDVNAVDTVTITLSAGTAHKDAAEYLLNAPVYQQVAPTYHHIIRVTGNDKFRTEFVSATISYGTCCSGGGSGTMSNWILSDGSTTQQIDNAETVTFADGTFINNVVSATNTVTTDLSATGSPGATTFLRGDNTWAVPVGTTYAKATDSVLGLVKLEDVAVQSVAANAITTTASRTYGVQFNASDQLVVNVPWTDTASGCADVYKTITDGSNPFSASGCTDTLTFESPNNSIGVDTQTADTVKLNLDRGKFESMTITLTDENRVMTDGIKYQFRMPYAFTLANYHTVSSNCGNSVEGHVNVGPSGAEAGALQVKIWYSTHTTGTGSWTALTSTNIHIDAGELTSTIAATQPVLSKTSLACGEWLRFEVTQSTGAERGLKVNLIGYQTALAPV